VPATIWLDRFQHAQKKQTIAGPEPTGGFELPEVAERRALLQRNSSRNEARNDEAYEDMLCLWRAVCFEMSAVSVTPCGGGGGRSLINPPYLILLFLFLCYDASRGTTTWTNSPSVDCGNGPPPPFFF